MVRYTRATQRQTPAFSVALGIFDVINLSRLFKRPSPPRGDTSSWDKDGFLKLPGFYSHSEIDKAREAQESAWRERHPRIVVDDLVTGERLKLRDVDTQAAKTHRFKLNDLYLEIDAIRALALNDRISPLLNKLLGERVVLCNSLSFDQGSSQPDHVDALYMTPRTPHSLVAIWVALEDCHMDAGPLRYYPGSHKIPAYRFSNDSLHSVPEEMGAWHAHMAQQIRERNLKAETFAAEKGDVFIWSCYLLHGGMPIADPARTRKSLVFHYYTESDCIANQCTLIEDAGAFWMHRAHQPTNGELTGDLPPLPVNR